MFESDNSINPEMAKPSLLEIAAPSYLENSSNLYDQEPFLSAVSEAVRMRGSPNWPARNESEKVFLQVALSNTPRVYPDIRERLKEIPQQVDNYTKLFIERDGLEKARRIAEGFAYLKVGIKPSELKQGLPKNTPFVDMSASITGGHYENLYISMVLNLQKFPLWEEYVRETKQNTFKLTGDRLPRKDSMPTPSYANWVTQRLQLVNSSNNPSDSETVLWRVPPYKE